MTQFPVTKTIKDSIRQAIGQTATFVFEGTPSGCSVCYASGYYDPVNETSLNPFCYVCSGTYWLPIETSSGVVAHVRWSVGDESDFGIAGDVPVGMCSITIDIDSIPEQNIVKIKEIRVDSRVLEVFRITRRGIPSRDRL